MRLCLLRGEGCSLKALPQDADPSRAGVGLTVIKTSCKVMMGLGWHPGEAEALATLGRIPCLDRAHLERGDTLHLEAKGQTSVTAPCWCHPRPESWGHPGLGAWLYSATPNTLGLASPAGALTPSPALPPAPARRLAGCQPRWGTTVVEDTDLADNVLVEGPI